MENAVHQGDCVKGLQQLMPGTVDLAFADPPFNIGYEYDVYRDKQSYDDYLTWTRAWMSAVSRALKPTGTFWIAIGDEYAAEFKLIAQKDLGLNCRSWVIWYYTFGVNCTRKFNRSHAHLFHFVKDAKQFTFNARDPAIRVKSARQMVYADGRANPNGRLPDDTWILRPQDVDGGFSVDQDTWYFPRVAGTFKERAGFHGCQMPEQLLGRIVRASSNPGDLVLDPFVGSGTSLVVAKKLERRWIGFELSREYAKKARERIENAKPGHPLDGSADPLRSAPATLLSAITGRNGGTKPQPANSGPLPNVKNATTGTAVVRPAPRGNSRSDDERSVIDAYLAIRNGHASDQILADPELNAEFLSACEKKGVTGSQKDWNKLLLRLRKSSRLPGLGIGRKPLLDRVTMDKFGFASEIALQHLTSALNVTLDDVLCDPELAILFDRIAVRHAPGFRSFEYRWAAMTLRKRAHRYRKIAPDSTSRALPPERAWSRIDFKAVDHVSGVYLLKCESSVNRNLYLGETLDLGSRLRLHYDATELGKPSDMTPVGVRVMHVTSGLLKKHQAAFVARHHPQWNYRELASA